MSDDQSEKRVKREKVISGEAKTRQKSGLLKFSEVFVTEDIRTVKNNLLTDVAVPAVKALITDMVTSGIQMILYGGTTNRPNTAPGAKYNYGNHYNSLSQGTPKVRTNYTGYSYDDPIVTNRGDAERILQEMSEIIHEYGQASIADLYDLCGITGRPTDMNYGWTEMPGARSIRVPEGYVIQMPKPVCIKD